MAMAQFDDDEVDGFVLVSAYDEDGVDRHNACAPEVTGTLDEVSEAVAGVAEAFWPVNKRIHDNPELGFREFIAHDALTAFMRAQDGWKVTPSAYGMKTAWVAVFDTGKKGPVVSFNAEMGKTGPRATRLGDHYRLTQLFLLQTACQVSATPAATT